ncbi:MAG: hypothetical protein KJ939_04310 [Nanoarchaeota archaeon]|nr:hypothetical protein [Nanoarchaeota archaeon]MBU4352278.1 hypothetical protein [Nanoarchaeota archaeon]
MRKGQATMFVILGIILVAVIILGFTLKDQFLDQLGQVKPLKSVKLQAEVDEVNRFVEDCLESSSKEAAYIILSNGGFTALDETNSIDVYARLVPIYYNLGQENVPTKKDLEINVAEYTSYLLEYCLLDLDSFNYEVEQKEFNLDVSIKDEINLKLELPLTITKGNDSEKIEMFYQTLELDMLTPYNEAIEIYNFIKTSPTDAELSEFVSTKDYLFASDRFNEIDVYALKFENMPIENVDIDDEFVIFPFGIKEKVEEVNVEEISDETLSYILTFPELFNSEEELVDEFEEPALEEIIDLDNEAEFGGFDVS